MARIVVGYPHLDDLADQSRPSIHDYCLAASEYVTHATTLGRQYVDDIAAYEAELAATQISDGDGSDELGQDLPEGMAEDGRRARGRRRPPSKGKVAQIRLSAALGRVLLSDLRSELQSRNVGLAPSERTDGFEQVVAGERKVGGGLRSVNADVSEVTAENGLTLAVEIKPVHLAVGRAIWNRFGDIRSFAVNIHLKFPFAVVAAVTTYPTMERVVSGNDDRWKSTEHLIVRAISRFRKAGARNREDQAPYLLEGTAVVVFDPRTGAIHDDLPPAGQGLRWDEFVAQIVDQYVLRFVED